MNLKKIIKRILPIIIASHFLVSSLQAEGLGTELAANIAELEVGQVVTVNLNVEPEANSPVFTVSANLVYDPGKLEFVSSTMYEEWLEIKQKENYITDTINGLLVRTGGFPSGILGTTKFVTYKFKAKEAGDTKILITTGNAYDEKNSNLGIKRSELTIKISGSGSEQEDYQEQIVDLNLKIDADNAFYRQEPYTFTIYHKQEEIPQQAITKIWMFDENWNVVYEDEKLWRTDQDTVLDFIIPADTLEREGNYKIIGKVRYEDESEFEIIEKDLGVLSNGKTWFTKNSHIFMPVFFFVAFVSIIHHLFMEREMYFKLRRLLNSDHRKTRRK